MSYSTTLGIDWARWTTRTTTSALWGARKWKQIRKRSEGWKLMFGLRKVNRNTHTFETTFQNWKENGEDVALLMPEFSAKWLPIAGWCCQLTDLVYDGVFEVLQWLLFLSAVPPVQLLTGWCVTAKAPPDISAISALTAVKHGNCSSLTPLLNPVRTRKSLIWPWMALDAGQPPALWALASTRFYVT